MAAMKLNVFLSLVVLATAKFEFQQEWEDWKMEQGKEYQSTEEELARHVIWEANKHYIDNHNQHADVFGFTLAINEFSDLSSAEFAKMYNGYRSNMEQIPGELFEPSVPVEALPDTVDWRERGYVTEVKNQGQCGSCWAFSTTGSLEGQHFNATGSLVSLSEQNLVDCSKKEGNDGCEGGLMDQAFEYIIKNGGIDTEESYPYKAHKEKCKFKQSDVGATCSKYKKIWKGSEKLLQVAVGTIGPVSVAIDASRGSFQHYKDGVYYERMCSDRKLDHGVLAVGYGKDGDKEYWLVKNSWGKKWGMDGYIMMTRNHDNNCGIATSAGYPVI